MAVVVGRGSLGRGALSSAERLSTPPVYGPRFRILRWIPPAAAAATATIGVAVLFGWILDVYALKHIAPGLASMKANTAVCFVACGLALWLLPRVDDVESSVRPYAVPLSIVPLVIGAATLGEYVFQRSIGIDQFLFQDPISDPPGRMAVLTATNFVLVGTTLAFCAIHPRKAYLAIHVLTLPALVIALIALLGFVYGADELYQLKPSVSVAIHTVLGFVLLCAGLTATRPDRGVMALLIGDGPGSTLARRLLLPAIVAPAVVGWLRLVGEEEGLYGTQFGTALFSLSNIAIFSTVVCLTGFSLNATDRKRRQAETEVFKLNAELEVRVSQRTAKLQLANGELEDFTHVVSHDLKEPLRGIEAFSGFLTKDYGDKLDETGRRYLCVLRESAERMRDLIDDLLETARIGRVKPNRAPVDMSPLLARLQESLAFTLSERNVDLHIQEDLPTVICDPTRFTQVFENLVVNAIKYNDKPTPTIDITCDDQGDAFRFCIRDNGPGIAPEYREKVFGVFQRLVRRDEQEGTGIGLAICKKIAEGRGGATWIESNPEGAGCCFYFTVPTTVPQNDEEGER